MNSFLEVMAKQISMFQPVAWKPDANESYTNIATEKDAYSPVKLGVKVKGES